MRYRPLLVVPSGKTVSGGSLRLGDLFVAINRARRARIAAVAPPDLVSETAPYDGAALPTAAAAATISAELSTDTQSKTVPANHPIIGALRNPALATKLGE